MTAAMPTFASLVIPGSPAIDPEAIEQLRLLEDDDQPNVVAELVTLYLDHAPPKLAAIRDGIAAGDAGAVKRAAHSLKGSSANVGARGMQQVCEALEQQAGGGNVSGAPALLGQLEQELAVVTAALRAEVAGG
jgi:HPt (histidine-containing phosphotransfer) domain-containing protein